MHGCLLDGDTALVHAVQLIDIAFSWVVATHLSAGGGGRVRRRRRRGGGGTHPKKEDPMTPGLEYSPLRTLVGA